MIEKIFIVLRTNIYILMKKLLSIFYKGKVKCKFLCMLYPHVYIKSINGTIILNRKCVIKSNTEVSVNGGNIVLGEGCFINRNCMLISHENISIGDNTTIGPGVYIYDHDHDMKGGYNTAPIMIGKNVWIGAGTIILKGVTIGDNSVIGAGTLVLHDVPENSKFYNQRLKNYDPIN